MDIRTEIIQRTLCIPQEYLVSREPQQGFLSAIQLDSLLMEVGFKLSPQAFDYISNSPKAYAMSISQYVLEVLKNLVGDHINHNPYFKNFPRNVPDTVQFWIECMYRTLEIGGNPLNLLDCPTYGIPQHQYEDLLKAHAALVPNMKNRITLIGLGDMVDKETVALYRSLAESPAPLNEVDRELLKTIPADIARAFGGDVPLKENLAILNAVLVRNRLEPTVFGPTDVLRLCCELSGGDVTLETPTKFISFPRHIRRSILLALDSLDTLFFSEIHRYGERWKRLAERLHPGDRSSLAKRFFSALYGWEKGMSLERRIESLFQEKRNGSKEQGLDGKIVKGLGVKPGMLFRSLDHVLRECDPHIVLDAIKEKSPLVSGRVLLSVYEHFMNRYERSGKRIFTNRRGRSWVTDDNRKPIGDWVITGVLSALIFEIRRRLRAVIGNRSINPDIRNWAIPLSDKQTPPGFQVIPRGTEHPVGDFDVLRFFCYWKQRDRQTDYDLSCSFLGQDFTMLDQVSWTQLKSGFSTHSGDITDAHCGATEFIDLRMGKIPDSIHYIVPHLNIYSGEGFMEVEESFFGYMERDLDQFGTPFEARTVVNKSSLMGESRVALPLVIMRNPDMGWSTRWMHLYSKGSPNMNRVEGNYLTTSLLVRAIIQKTFLKVDDLALDKDFSESGEGGVITNPRDLIPN